MKKLLFFLCFILSFSIIKAQSDQPNTSMGMTIDLPLINNASFYRYDINGNGQTDNQTGYFGAGFAFFYKKNKNKFSIGYQNPSFNKSFAPPKGGASNLHADIFEATFHHKVLSQIALIGGINYVDYRYHLFTDIPPFPKVDKKDKTLGLTVGAEFVPVNSISVAILYRPSVYCFDKKAYRAILSLGLKYDINFWNKKSR